MQFLVRGNDNSLSIIYKKSIIVDKIDAPLAIGDSVKFLWPENGKIKKQFSGIIIAKSDDEKVLLAKKEAEMRKWKTGAKHYGKMKPLTDSCAPYGQGKKRKQGATLLESEILTSMNATKNTRTQDCELVGTQTPEWAFDAIGNFKQEVCRELDSVKENILKKIDFFQSSFTCNHVLFTEPAEKADSKVAAESRRRSYGMPLDFDDITGEVEENPIENDVVCDVSTCNTTQPQIQRERGEEFDGSEKFEKEIIELSSDDSFLDDFCKTKKLQINDEPLDQPASKIDDCSSMDASELHKVCIKNEEESSGEESQITKQPSTSSFFSKQMWTSKKPGWMISSDEEDEAQQKLRLNWMISSDEEDEDQQKLRVKEREKIPKSDHQNVKRDMNFSRKSASASLPNKYSSSRKRSLILSSSEDEENEPPNYLMKFKKAKAMKGCLKVKNYEKIKKDKISFNSDNEIEQKDDRGDSSEWTLKYREPGDSLKELIKGSGVYVNRIDVETATNSCSNQNDLARGLMKAVFTDVALMKCSLTGAKPRVPGKNKEVKPGLDEKGVNAILNYVNKYAKSMNWPPKERTLIRRSMSQKLLEMHAE